MDCHFKVEDERLYWQSCGLKYGCGSVGCKIATGPGFYNEVGGYQGSEETTALEEVEATNGLGIDDILDMANLDIALAIEMALAGGYTVI